VYAQNHRVSGIFTSCSVLRTRKDNISEAGSVSVFKLAEGGIYSAGSLTKF
jgi:hypothetical protein